MGISQVRQRMILGINKKVEEEIVQIAEKNNISKVIVFGSRSRGDYHRTSDIDLAVSGGNYSRFCLDVDEDTSTLLEYDIVNLDGRVDEDLLESIIREGQVVYEKI